MPSAPVTVRSRYPIASSIDRNAAGGWGSSGASSSLIRLPSRSYGQPAKLCATNFRAPAARAPASRLSVPSVRRRFVGAKSRSKWRGAPMPDSAVTSWTTTSGFAITTASMTASRSSASATTGSPPSSRTTSGRDRVMPATSCPRETSSGTSRLPTAPVAPATKTFMVSSFVSSSLGRDSLLLCDSTGQARHRQGEPARPRALMPALALAREVHQVVVEVDLHGVPRRGDVALEHLAPLALHVAAHLALRRQRVLPAQVLADPLALRLGERHRGAERLQQGDEEDVREPRVEDAPEQRQVVVRRRDEAGVEERERDLVAGR